MGADAEERRRPGKKALVDAIETFGSDSLRDVWLFDQSDHEPLFLREDVERKIADLDVATFIDVERYGYVTRDTYGDLYYASYEYTVRGFADFEKFRTFLSDDAERIGVFASFDRRDGGYDFGALHDEIESIAAEHPIDSFFPE